MVSRIDFEVLPRTSIYDSLQILNVDCINVIVLILQPVSNADFIVPVEIEGTIHQVGVICLHTSKPVFTCNLSFKKLLFV